MLSKPNIAGMGASVALCMLMSSSLLALPTQVSHIDLPQCDPLSIPSIVDEVGDPIAGFPTNETLQSADLGVANPSCAATDDSLQPDAYVSITNTSGRDYQEVWYVADELTRISNVDGFANGFPFPATSGQEAFRIDNSISDPGGVNRPLYFESMIVDGIWQNGEEWRFVLQDYGNLLGLPASAIASIGVGNASTDDPTVGALSSGSIIAVVPEPASLALLGIASLLSLTCRTSAKNRPNN